MFQSTVLYSARAVQLGVELAGIADLLWMRPFTVDAPEHRLDPGLILRVCGRLRANLTVRGLGRPGLRMTLTAPDPEPLRLSDHHRVPDKIRPCDGPATGMSIQYTHGPGRDRRAAALTSRGGLGRGVAVSADGRTAVSGGSDRTMRVWNLADYREQVHWMADASILAVAFTCNTTVTVTGDTAGQVHALS